MKELQLIQTKIGELMNFKEATGNTVTKLVEAVSIKLNWDLALLLINNFGIIFADNHVGLECQNTS
jgi:hypothetical protein